MATDHTRNGGNNLLSKAAGSPALVVVLCAVVFCAMAIVSEAGRPDEGYFPPPRASVPLFPQVPGLLRVPMTRQAADYTCGVAALQSVLGYYNREFREDQLIKRLEVDPEQGTRYRSMVELARTLGFRADVLTGMTLPFLRRTLDRGLPVIVLLQAWRDGSDPYAEDWENGHYAVAIGHDQQRVYFMDPSTLGHYTFIPNSEFLQRWHDVDGSERLVHFGLVLYPLDEDPPTADPFVITPMN